MTTLALCLLITVLVTLSRAPWGRPGSGVRQRSRPDVPTADARLPKPVPPDALAQLVQLAGLLRAGLAVPDALAQLSVGDDWWARAGQAFALAEPIPMPGPEHPELRRLAVTLSVMAGSGGPAGEALDAVAEALRFERDAAAAVQSALAGPTATARLLIMLPVLGLGLGQLSGADPFGVLFTPGIGSLALAVGVIGNLTGWWWSRRLISAASPAQPFS